MKTNVELKGILMLCAIMGLFILYVQYFQDSKMGTIILIALTALLLFVVYWISDNTNDKQFERIMKKAGGDNLLYIVDGSAAVEIDSLVIYYGLYKKEYDWIFKSNNYVDISVSCALPAVPPTKDVFNAIRNDLAACLEKDIAKCVHYKYRCYSFSIHFKLHPRRISVAILQQIQQSLVSILINEYHLNTIKQYLKTDEIGAVYYWEFVGYNAVRFVRYNAENNVCDYDNEDVSYDLSDIKNATVITEKEFESVYAAVENIKSEEQFI